jgi:polar amino acid transport system permease protein
MTTNPSNNQALGSHPSHSHAMLRPWFRRSEYLIGTLVFLLTYAIVLLPPSGTLTSLDWIFVTFFFLASLTWVGLVVTDGERPTWMGGIASLGLLVVFGWLFYRYSGAKWDRLIFVFFNMDVMSGKGWPSMFKAFGLTLELGFFSGVFAILSGLILAVVRSFNNKILNYFILSYINIFRALPTIVLAALVYYALPYLGVKFSGIVAGVITLGLNHGAFSSEIFRAGIESVHHGQIEAAHALGFDSLKTMKLVILPQAFRVVIPPLTGQMVALLKETAICSTIGILELMRQALIIQAWKANPTPLIVATIIYLLVLIPLTRLSRYLEMRMKYGERR